MFDPFRPRAAGATPQQFTLVLFPELAELVRLTAWVDEAGRKLGLSMQRLYALQLCLEELVATVIVRAQPKPNLPMSIVVALIPKAEGLEVRVEHNGEPCDSALPQGGDDDSVVSLPELHLTRRFGTNIAFYRDAGLTRVTVLLAD